MILPDLPLKIDGEILRAHSAFIHLFTHINIHIQHIIPQQRPLTQIKHNSLFGTERSLLLAQKVNNSQRYA